jgi:hypothetical protein
MVSTLPVLSSMYAQAKDWSPFCTNSSKNLVIDERLVTESIDNRLREMERGLDLVFVIMPPPLKMEAKREDYAVRLLRKAIGYHIQLNI